MPTPNQSGNGVEGEIEAGVADEIHGLAAHRGASIRVRERCNLPFQDVFQMGLAVEYLAALHLGRLHGEHRMIHGMAPDLEAAGRRQLPQFGMIQDAASGIQLGGARNRRSQLVEHGDPRIPIERPREPMQIDIALLARVQRAAGFDMPWLILPTKTIAA